MKYGKLVEIRKKARRYSILSTITMLGAVSALVGCLMALAGNEVSKQIFPLLGLLTIVLSTVFTRLEGKQNRRASRPVNMRLFKNLRAVIE